MKIGAFSMSLNVKDIYASREFYSKLGFIAIQGNEKEHWLIMRNEDITIGLFEGMFESNIMTFNPGWDKNAQNEKHFTDIRELQKQWKAKGIKFLTYADETTQGPASFEIKDPDGNVILIDQHR